MLTEGQQKLEAAGLFCGPSAALARQLAAAYLATCNAPEAAEAGGAAAAAALARQAVLPEAVPQQQQQEAQPQQQTAAETGSGGRSKRRSALAAQAAIAAAVWSGEEEEAAVAGRQRRSVAAAQQQQQLQVAEAEAVDEGTAADQENAGMLMAPRPGSKAAAARRISSLASGLSALGQKQALLPTVQPESNSKRLRQ